MRMSNAEWTFVLGITAMMLVCGGDSRFQRMAQILTRKRLIWLMLAILALCGSMYAGRTELLSAIGNFLVVRDDLEPADIIFLLNGDATVRPQHAVTLLRRGLAPKIVIARVEDSVGVLAGAYPNVTDSNLVVLQSLGIDESQIVQLRPSGGVKHTADEADQLLAYSRQQSLRKVIIVTSDLHSRRARFIFRKRLSGGGVKIMMSPIPDRKYGADNWWKVEDGLVGCQNEYLKLFYYHLKY